MGSNMNVYGVKYERLWGKYERLWGIVWTVINCDWPWTMNVYGEIDSDSLMDDDSLIDDMNVYGEIVWIADSHGFYGFRGFLGFGMGSRG